jgi:hypothetical protein
MTMGIGESSGVRRLARLSMNPMTAILKVGKGLTQTSSTRIFSPSSIRRVPHQDDREDDVRRAAVL